ncbi:MAG: trigger factor [Candidatus Obscuribacterales bacterium]|nr:trigger factor [Candidatus Obscuribacterales bacterium]
MKVSLEREGKNVVKVGVEVESTRAMKAYEVACRQVSHRLNIPGFRRGKAPRNIVERAVGVDYLKREALENLVPEILGRVIMDEKLDVITEPQVDSWEFNPGEPLKLNASFEVRPEVNAGQYRGVSVQVPEAKLPEDALERAMKNVAEARATLQTVEPKPIETGDTVLLDFECFVDGNLVEGGKAEGLVLEIKEGNFLDGFCEQLVGAEPGQSREVQAKFPENYRNRDLANKEAKFKVDVKEIRTRVLPELNEEFAKSLGQESLEKLKEALYGRLEQEVKGENEARTQKLVVDAVVAGANVEIPESMIERESNLLLSHLKHFVQERGQSWEEYVNAPEYPNIYKEKKEEATQRVLTSLVLGAIVRAEGLSVTEEESAPFLAELLNRYNVPIERIRQDEQVRRAAEQLSRQAMEEALTRKVVDFLVAQAKIDYVPEEEESESKPEAASEEAPKAKKGKKAAKEQQSGEEIGSQANESESKSEETANS